MKRSLVIPCLFGLLSLVGCDPKADGIEGVAQPTGFAVLHSDYSTASIALLGPDGKIVKKRFVHSGSTFAGLESALSGDAMLPTVSNEAGVLTYFERSGADMVTRIDIEAGEVLSQLKVQDENDSSGYSSNPQDYLYVDANSAWITRYEPNLEGGAKTKDPGNDLLMINPGASKRTSTRISFDKFNDKGTVENPDTGETMEVTIYARPGRMAMAGDRLVVGLSRLSASFDAIGVGMVAVVDLEKKSAQSLELGALTNCSTVLPVLDDNSRVIVSCTGFYNGDRSDGAGLAIVNVEAGEASVESMWRAAKHRNAPMATSNPASLGGSKVVAIADGDLGENPDRAYIVDIETGDQTLLAEATGSYVLGVGYFLADTHIFLLPDGSTDESGVLTAGLRRFELNEDQDPKELEPLQTDKTLPPLMVQPLF